MSKKDDSPAISLFSFQDIITSITGIMFLVVLLLLLLIFESKPVTPQEKQSDKDRQAMQALAQEINTLKMQIQKLKDMRKELEKELAEYQKMTPQMIEEKKLDLEQKVKELTEKNVKLKLAVSQADMHGKQTVERIKTLEKNYTQIIKDIEKETKISKEKNKEITELQKRLETIKKTVVFSVEQNSDRNPLLAEFTPTGFIVFDFGANKTFDLRQSGKDANAAFDDFLDFLKQRDSSTETLSIILSPASLKYWDIISLKLKDTGFRHGLELLPDDNSTVFGKNSGGGK